MKNDIQACTDCGAELAPQDTHRLNRDVFCEDCYIDRVHPKCLKPHYKHDKAGFMRRLKQTYAVVKQEND